VTSNTVPDERDSSLFIKRKRQVEESKIEKRQKMDDEQLFVTSRFKIADELLHQHEIVYFVSSVEVADPSETIAISADNQCEVFTKL